METPQMPLIQRLPLEVAQDIVTFTIPATEPCSSEALALRGTCRLLYHGVHTCRNFRFPYGVISFDETIGAPDETLHWTTQLFLMITLHGQRITSPSNPLPIHSFAFANIYSLSLDACLMGTGPLRWNLHRQACRAVPFMVSLRELHFWIDHEKRVRIYDGLLGRIRLWWGAQDPCITMLRFIYKWTNYEEDGSYLGHETMTTDDGAPWRYSSFPTQLGLFPKLTALYIFTCNLLTLSLFDESPMVYHHPEGQVYPSQKLTPPPLGEDDDPSDLVLALRGEWWTWSQERLDRMLEMESGLVALLTATSPSLRRVSLTYGIDAIWKVPSDLNEQGYSVERPGRHVLYRKDAAGVWKEGNDQCRLCTDRFRPVGVNIHDPILSEAYFAGDVHCQHYMQDMDDPSSPARHPFSGNQGVTFWCKTWNGLAL